MEEKEVNSFGAVHLVNSIICTSMILVFFGFWLFCLFFMRKEFPKLSD